MVASTIDYMDRVRCEDDARQIRAQPRRPRAERGPAAAILALQASAGNKAVAGLLQRVAAARSPSSEAVLQRFDMTYGALKNDCGSDMHVYIDGKNDPDLGKGSKPSVVPSWWTKADAAAQQYLTSYVVQGHLLNMKLGGPGDKLENLTPITKSTNTTHLTKIETEVKSAIDKDFGVEYRVRPDYATHPVLADLGHSAPVSLTPLLAYMAGTIGADYDIYDRSTKKKVSGLPGEMFIKNEGAHLKGSY